MADTKKILILGPEGLREDVCAGDLTDFDFHFITDNPLQLDSFPASDFDLILLDAATHGNDSLLLIRQINASTHGMTPIILITGQGQEKLAVAATNEGVSDALAKEELVPVLLHMTMHRAMERKRWKKIYKDLSTEEENTSFLKDALTGLYNLGYFKTRLAEEKMRSQRYSFPLTLVLFNIDQFSVLNKKYGSIVGDTILRELGQMLTRNTRSSDLLSRIKDDQFALLLPHTTAEQAKGVWQRVLGQMATYPFIVKEDNYYITVRAALVALHEESDNFDVLFKKVEGFMKKHKDDEDNPVLYASAHLG